MREEELLREKRRYGLEEKISAKEKEMLSSGIPIQKIIGFIDFDNLKISVDENVLIPRYETQEVVNEALKYINKDSKVLDLCAGSGYIGLTVKQKTSANVTMSDISDSSIKQMHKNASTNNLDVKIVKSNLFENINDKFNVIISNPPYIPNSKKISESVTKHEPNNALFGGVDGNDFYREIIKYYKNYLFDKGVIIFEISEDNKNYLSSCGFEIKNDINKKPRIAIKKIQ